MDVFGAITDTASKRARDHASMYYDEIRHMTTDVDRIAENTGFSINEILLVKNYLFMNKHVLEEGEEPQYFEPSFEIAQSWQRLMSDPAMILPHDIILLKHELMEQRLVCDGCSQYEAHLLTSKKYNYSDASDKYYQSLGMSVGKDETNSGAIRRSVSHRTH